MNNNQFITFNIKNSTYKILKSELISGSKYFNALLSGNFSEKDSEINIETSGKNFKQILGYLQKKSKLTQPLTKSLFDDLLYYQIDYPFDKYDFIIIFNDNKILFDSDFSDEFQKFIKDEKNIKNLDINDNFINIDIDFTTYLKIYKKCEKQKSLFEILQLKTKYFDILPFFDIFFEFKVDINQLFKNFHYLCFYNEYYYCSLNLFSNVGKFEEFNMELNPKYNFIQFQFSFINNDCKYKCIVYISKKYEKNDIFHIQLFYYHKSNKEYYFCCENNDEIIKKIKKQFLPSFIIKNDFE